MSLSLWMASAGSFSFPGLCTAIFSPTFPSARTADLAMGAHHKSRIWRLCRLYFRSFRILVWLLILAALGALVYINQIGLPDLVKTPLLERLRSRGLDLQFSRLRLSWNQGIIAENVHFGPADQQISPHLNVAEVQVRLNWNA